MFLSRGTFMKSVFIFMFMTMSLQAAELVNNINPEEQRILTMLKDHDKMKSMLDNAKRLLKEGELKPESVNYATIVDMIRSVQEKADLVDRQDTSTAYYDLGTGKAAVTDQMYQRAAANGYFPYFAHCLSMYSSTISK